MINSKLEAGCALQAPDQSGRGSVLAAGAAGRAADQGEAARGEALPRRPGPTQVKASVVQSRYIVDTIDYDG